MDQFDVVLLGLHDERTRAQTVTQLQTLFRLDEQVAVMMLATAPTTVKRDVSTDQAEKYFHALASIGVKVELRRRATGGATVVGTHDPQSAGQVMQVTMTHGAPAEPIAPPTMGPLEGDVETGDTRSFWASIPDALAMPLRGQGIPWLLVSSIMGVMLTAALVFGGVAAATSVGHVAGAFAFYPLLGAGALAAFFTGTTYYYARACVWGVLSEEPDPQATGEIDPTFVISLFKDGLVLLGFHAALEFVWLVWAYRLASSGADTGMLLAVPVLVALLVFSVAYWPMGIGLAVLENSAFGFVKLGKAVRLFLAAPLEYLALTVLTNLVWIGPWVATSFLAIFLGPWLAVAAALLLSPLLAYSQALQGSLIGHLFRTQAELLSEYD